MNPSVKLWGIISGAREWGETVSEKAEGLPLAAEFVKFRTTEANHEAAT